MKKPIIKTEDLGQFNALRQHAWDYFKLHANQRISLFKLYLAIASLFATGIGVLLWHLKDRGNFPEKVGIGICILFLLSTVIFWLIDLRIRSLIHCSEEAIRQIEDHYIELEKKNLYLKIFCQEKRNRPCRLFRHTGLFSTLFTINILSCFYIIVSVNSSTPSQR